MRFLAIIFGVFLWVCYVDGHGYIRNPAARASAWRDPRNSATAKIDYNDMGLFCGGAATQWSEEIGGKCGLCGDPYNGTRLNEPGSLYPNSYANGTKTGNYSSGDVINVTITITANHKGYFVFKLCPHDDCFTNITQECLDDNLLYIPSTNSSKFYLPSSDTGDYTVDVQLPADATGSCCVLQWTYVTGNSWGTDPVTNATGLGYGPQEHFVNCADVAIIGSTSDSQTTTPLSTTLDTETTNNAASSTNAPTSTTSSTTTPTATTTTPTTTTTNSTTTTTKPTTSTPPTTTTTTPTTTTTKPTTTKPPTKTTTTPTTTTTPPTTSTTTPTTTTTTPTTTTTTPTTTTTTPTTTTTTPTTTTTTPTTTTTTPTTTTTTPTTTTETDANTAGVETLYDEDCVGNSNLVCAPTSASLRKWCQSNCILGQCYPDLCFCSCTNLPKHGTYCINEDLVSCDGFGSYAGAPGYQSWCCDNGGANCGSPVCRCTCA